MDKQKDLKKEIEELMEIINWTSYVEVDVFEEKSSLKKQEKVAGDLIRRKALDFLVKIKLQERKKTLEEVRDAYPFALTREEALDIQELLVNILTPVELSRVEVKLKHRLKSLLSKLKSKGE